MSDIFEMVEKFNREVIGIKRPMIKQLDAEEALWLVSALREEIDEYVHDQTMVGQVDALLDLIYFAAGGLTRMGIPAKVSNKLFETVHEANMQKRKGLKVREVTHNLDAVKPENWQPPEGSMAAILKGNKEA